MAAKRSHVLSVYGPWGGRGRPMHLVAYDVCYSYVNIHLYYYTNIFCLLILSLRKYVYEQ